MFIMDSNFQKSQSQKVLDNQMAAQWMEHFQDKYRKQVFFFRYLSLTHFEDKKRNILQKKNPTEAIIREEILAGTLETEAEALSSYEKTLRQRKVKKLKQGLLLKISRNLKPCQLSNRFKDRIFTISSDNAESAPLNLKGQNNGLLPNFKLKL